MYSVHTMARVSSKLRNVTVPLRRSWDCIELRWNAKYRSVKGVSSPPFRLGTLRSDLYRWIHTSSRSAEKGKESKGREKKALGSQERRTYLQHSASIIIIIRVFI